MICTEVCVTTAFLYIRKTPKSGDTESRRYFTQCVCRSVCHGAQVWQCAAAYSLTHTHTHTHKDSHTHTTVFSLDFSLTHTLSHTHTHSHTHTLSLTHTHTHNRGLSCLHSL